MNAGWYSFFERIRGYNIEVSLGFTRNFIGTQVNFASMSFEVSEASIAEAIGFPTEGDQWFKEEVLDLVTFSFLVGVSSRKTRYCIGTN